VFYAKNTKQQRKRTDLGSFSQASRHCRPEVKGSISRVIKYAYLQKKETTNTVAKVLYEPFSQLNLLSGVAIPATRDSMSTVLVHLRGFRESLS
jgi:hypothetical protein